MLLPNLVRIDPIELAYIPASEELSPSFWVAHRSLKDGMGVRKRLWRYARQLWSVSRRDAGPLPPYPTGAIVLVSLTSNQRASLSPVAEALRKEGVAAVHLDLQDGEARLPFLKRALPIATAFLPALAVSFIRSRGYARRSFAWAADTYLTAFGLYAVARSWLRAGKPRFVVVANDHTVWPRAFVRAAKDLGIPTAYVQHAAVATGFPKLETDLAFLEGEVALSVYAAAGPTTAEAYLVGIAKLDSARRSAGVRDERERIAVCANAFDPIERITSVVDAIRIRLHSARCVVRPHPAMTPRAAASLMQIAMASGSEWSDPRTESAVDLLSAVTRLVAGESSILLEAAATGVDPIMYDFPETNLDRYQFVRRGLAPQCRGVEELIPLLSQPRRSVEELAQTVRQFSETAGTPLAGRTGELIADVLLRKLARATAHFAWQPAGNSSIVAFRPANSTSPSSTSR